MKDYFRNKLSLCASVAALVLGFYAPAVAGVPIARNAALIELGVGPSVASNVELGVSYSGQLGDGVQDHGVRANATFRF